MKIDGASQSGSVDDRLAALGASRADLAVHYDIGTEFHALWLARNLGYSCALWSGDPDQTLDQAEDAKIDFFAERLGIGPDTAVLDVGCGWGGPASRFLQVHGASRVVGLTLSASHESYCTALAVPGFHVELESWTQHAPSHAYDRVICFEALEHFANDTLGRDERIEVYEQFFERCHSWLAPGGRIGLQVICFDSVGYERAQCAAPVTDLVRRSIFPASSPPHLSEILLAWEPYFATRLIRGDGAHYARTFAAWLERLKANRTAIEARWGDPEFQESWKYLAGVHSLFRLRAWTLYRIVLDRRRKLKR